MTLPDASQLQQAKITQYFTGLLTLYPNVILDRIVPLEVHPWDEQVMTQKVRYKPSRFRPTPPLGTSNAMRIVPQSYTRRMTTRSLKVNYDQIAGLNSMGAEVIRGFRDAFAVAWQATLTEEAIVAIREHAMTAENVKRKFEGASAEETAVRYASYIGILQTSRIGSVAKVFTTFGSYIDPIEGTQGENNLFLLFNQRLSAHALASSDPLPENPNKRLVAGEDLSKIGQLVRTKGNLDASIFNKDGMHLVTIPSVAPEDDGNLSSNRDVSPLTRTAAFSFYAVMSGNRMLQFENYNTHLRTIGLYAEENGTDEIKLHELIDSISNALPFSLDNDPYSSPSANGRTTSAIRFVDKVDWDLADTKPYWDATRVVRFALPISHRVLLAKTRARSLIQMFDSTKRTVEGLNDLTRMFKGGFADANAGGAAYVIVEAGTPNQGSQIDGNKTYDGLVAMAGKQGTIMQAPAYAAVQLIDRIVEILKFWNPTNSRLRGTDLKRQRSEIYLRLAGYFKYRKVDTSPAGAFVGPELSINVPSNMHPLERALFFLSYFEVWTLDAFAAAAANGHHMPLSAIMLEPNATFETDDLLLCRGGKKFGKTHYTLPDVKSGLNFETRLAGTDWHIQSETIIDADNAALLLPHANVGACLGGKSGRITSNLEDIVNGKNASLYPILISCEEEKLISPLLVVAGQSPKFAMSHFIMAKYNVPGDLLKPFLEQLEPTTNSMEFLHKISFCQPSWIARADGLFEKTKESNTSAVAEEGFEPGGANTRRNPSAFYKVMPCCPISLY
jgi:hypothetical protein